MGPRAVVDVLDVLAGLLQRVGRISRQPRGYHGLGVAPPPVQLVCADMLAQSASTSAMKAFSLAIAAIIEYVTMLTPDVLTNGS